MVRREPALPAFVEVYTVILHLSSLWVRNRGKLVDFCNSCKKTCNGVCFCTIFERNSPI